MNSLWYIQAIYIHLCCGNTPLYLNPTENLVVSRSFQEALAAKQALQAAATAAPQERAREPSVRPVEEELKAMNFQTEFLLGTYSNSTQPCVESTNLSINANHSKCSWPQVV